MTYSNEISQLLKEVPKACTELYRRLNLIVSDEAVKGKVLAILDEADRVGRKKFIYDKIAAEDYAELGAYYQFFCSPDTRIEKFVEPSNDFDVAAIERRMKDEMGIDVAFENDKILANFTSDFFQRLGPLCRWIFPKKLGFFEGPANGIGSDTRGFVPVMTKSFAGIEKIPVYLRKDLLSRPVNEASDLAVDTQKGCLVHALSHLWHYRRGVWYNALDYTFADFTEKAASFIIREMLTAAC